MLIRKHWRVVDCQYNAWIEDTVLVLTYRRYDTTMRDCDRCGLCGEGYCDICMDTTHMGYTEEVVTI